MSSSTLRYLTGCWLLVPVLVLATGCGHKPAAPIVPVISQEELAVPNEIELFDAKATLVEPNLVQIEVKYRFTKGRPNKAFLCDIFFPGTPNHAAKSMDSWQMKPEGVIKDGVVLSKPPVKEFEIYISEAVTPQDGFKKVSNVIRGPVQ